MTHPFRVVSQKLKMRKWNDVDRNKAPRLHFWFQGQTIMDDLLTRYRKPYKVVREMLPQILADLGVECDRSNISWRQNAGCPCGCSPGFILREVIVDGKSPTYGFDIYVDLEVIQTPVADAVMCGPAGGSE